MPKGVLLPQSKILNPQNPKLIKKNPRRRGGLGNERK
jgi:hypothetical protein